MSRTLATHQRQLIRYDIGMNPPGRVGNLRAKLRRFFSSDIWLARASKLHLTLLERFGSAIFGSSLVVLGWQATRKVGSPEIAGVAFATFGTLFLILTIVGRIPHKMNGSGFGIEFETSDFKELLDIVGKSAPELIPEIEQMALRGGADRKIIRKTVESTIDSSSRENDVDENAINILSDKFSNLEARSSVPTPGRGRPPIVDAKFSHGEHRIALEVTSSWNNSVANVEEARLLRALTSAEIDAAVLVVPDDHYQKARSRISHNDIIILPESGLSGVETELDSHFQKLATEQ